MSDSGFVDIGDELVVRIGGYPVGKAVVDSVDNQGVHIEIENDRGVVFFTLPLDFKDYDQVDGVAHENLG